MEDAKANYRRVFKKFYERLIKTLPLDDLVTTLYGNGVLSDHDRDQLVRGSLSTPKEKAQYFLDEVIQKGLDVGFFSQFKTTIKIMQSSDNPVLIHLAEQIKAEWKPGTLTL